jgi:hypothetical protein
LAKSRFLPPPPPSGKFLPSPGKKSADAHGPKVIILSGFYCINIKIKKNSM